MSALLQEFFLVNLLFFPYIIYSFVLLYVARIFFDWTTPRYQLNQDLHEKKNYSVALMLGGYLLGVSLVIIGSFFGMDANHLNNATNLIISSLLAILLLRLSMIINDKLILHRFDIEKMIQEKQRLGVALVLASTLFASGLSLNGVVQGYSDNLLFVLRDTVIYWLFGQVILVLAGAVFQAITPYDVHEQILKDHPASAYSISGFFIAVGFIIRESLLYSTSDLGTHLVKASLFCLWGLLILVLSRSMIDTIVLYKRKISDEIVQRDNIAIGVIVGLSFIIVSLFVTGIHNNLNGGL